MSRKPAASRCRRMVERGRARSAGGGRSIRRRSAEKDCEKQNKNRTPTRSHMRRQTRKRAYEAGEGGREGERGGGDKRAAGVEAQFLFGGK